ncbi:hypothetical protein ACVWWR_006196 [Bradyrhizobium sp. LM3.2]
MIEPGLAVETMKSWIAPITAGVPTMVEAMVELLVVFDVASTITEPFIRDDALVPSDEPSFAVADVVTSLMASAPPMPPLAFGVLSATAVALVENELLLIARTVSELPDAITLPTERFAPVATLAEVETEPVE